MVTHEPSKFSGISTPVVLLHKQIQNGLGYVDPSTWSVHAAHFMFGAGEFLKNAKISHLYPPKSASVQGINHVWNVLVWYFRMSSNILLVQAIIFWNYFYYVRQD